MKPVRSASGRFSGSIYIDALARDCDQLWAEAKHRYSSGEKWWLDTSALVEIAAEEQSARYQGDPWEEIVGPWLEVPSSTSVSQVLEKCVNKPQAQWTQADKNRVGLCLRTLGWERIENVSASVWNGAGEGLSSEVPHRSTSSSRFVLRQLFAKKECSTCSTSFHAHAYTNAHGREFLLYARIDMEHVEHVEQRMFSID